MGFRVYTSSLLIKSGHSNFDVEASEMKQSIRIELPCEVLLVQIDRHCFFPDCEVRTLVGLTKKEAQEYHGFKCAACLRWNDDFLTEKDIPEWWAEIQRS